MSPPRMIVFVGVVASAALAFAGGDVAGDVRDLLDAGRFPEAVNTLERDDTLDDGERALLFALAHNGLGDWRQAEDHAASAVRLRPDDPDAHAAYAEALRYKMGDVNRVRALMIVGRYKGAIVRALELDPDHLEARSEQIGFLIDAPGIVGGDRDEARERIEDLARIAPARAMHHLDDLERALGNVDGRIEAHRRLLEVAPDDRAARLRLGQLLGSVGRHRDSDAVLARLAGAPEAWIRLGATYGRGRARVVGRFEPQVAVELFDAYLERHDGDRRIPSRAAATWRKGMALEQLGDRAAARAAFTRALELDPELEAAKDSLASLDRGQGR